MNNGIEIFYREPLFETSSIVYLLVLTSIILAIVILIMNLAINSFISDTEPETVGRIALRIFQSVLLIVFLTLSVILEYHLCTYLRNQTCIHARIHEEASYKYVVDHYEILEYDGMSGICTLQEK